MLKKRSFLLSGHATSVALEPEFWAVLDRMAEEAGESRAGFMARLDAARGRRPLASTCRTTALAWALAQPAGASVDGGSAGVGSDGASGVGMSGS